MLAAIVGDLPSIDSDHDPDVVQRDNGSWLVDGGLSIKRIKTIIGMNTNFPGETNNAYNTVGGFILYQLEKMPRVADSFIYAGWTFEVVDIDGTRIDKVLITPQSGAEKKRQE